MLIRNPLCRSAVIIISPLRVCLLRVRQELLINDATSSDVFQLLGGFGYDVLMLSQV